jgi:hypothetical protein
MKAIEIMQTADSLRRACRFGEAMNAYRQAAAANDATDDIRRRALASIELIQEINGFVNVDLLNP